MPGEKTELQMRVIIRFSLDDDTNRQPLRVSLKEALGNNGIALKAKQTSVYEGDGITLSRLQDALNKFWKECSRHRRARIDHFWMYVEGEESDLPTKKRHAAPVHIQTNSPASSSGLSWRERLARNKYQNPKTSDQ